MSNGKKHKNQTKEVFVASNNSLFAKKEFSQYFDGDDSSAVQTNS